MCVPQENSSHALWKSVSFLVLLCAKCQNYITSTKKKKKVFSQMFWSTDILKIILLNLNLNATDLCQWQFRPICGNYSFWFVFKCKYNLIIIVIFTWPFSHPVFSMILSFLSSNLLSCLSSYFSLNVFQFFWD